MIGRRRREQCAQLAKFPLLRTTALVVARLRGRQGIIGSIIEEKGQPHEMYQGFV